MQEEDELIRRVSHLFNFFLLKGTTITSAELLHSITLKTYDFPQRKLSVMIKLLLWLTFLFKPF